MLLPDFIVIVSGNTIVSTNMYVETFADIFSKNAYSIVSKTHHVDFDFVSVLKIILMNSIEKNF